MSRRRGEAGRAAVKTLDDLLVGVREQLMEARRTEHLPAAFREAVAELEVDVARLQSVTEWIVEGLLWVDREPRLRGRARRRR